MEDWVERSGLVDRVMASSRTEALEHLEEVLVSWILPFIAAWRTAGEQPLPNPSDVQTIDEMVDRLGAEPGSPPPGYEWLPSLLKEVSSSIRFNKRNFVNIHPNPYVPSIAASVVVALQNPNNIVSAVSKATTHLERECIAWMASNLIGFDASKATGNVVSGGTIANLTALLVARDYCYRKLARPRPSDVRSRGLWSKPEGVILATAGVALLSKEGRMDTRLGRRERCQGARSV